MLRVLFLTMFVSLLNAQAISNLILEEAYQYVQNSNQELRIAKFNSKISKIAEKIANAVKYGRLDVTVSAVRTNDAGSVFGFKLQSREASFADFGFDEFLAQMGAPVQQLLSTKPKKLNYPDARNLYNLDITYTIPLWTSGKIQSYKNIAYQMSKLAQYDLNKMVIKKKIEVKRAFLDLTLLHDYKIKLSKLKSNLVKLKSSVKELKKEGYAKKSDILEVEVKIFEIQRMLVQTRGFRELSLEFLSFLLNKKVKSIVYLDKYDQDGYDVIESRILKGNSDIKKAYVGKKIKQEMYKISKTNFKPQVGAFVGYGSSDDKLFHNLKHHDRYTVGIQMKLNLLNGGADEYKIMQNKLRVLKAKEQISLAKRGIVLKFKKIKIQIKSLNAQIKSLNKELKYSKEIYRIYKEKYFEGLVSINDVLIKQSMVIKKLLKILDIKNKKNKKVLELELLQF